jgi:hypothetical protein
VAANLIAPGSQASFVASQFALTNIGPFSAGNTATAVAGGYDVAASGRDIVHIKQHFGAAVRRVFGAFNVTSLHELIHQLTGGSGGYIKTLTDLGNATWAFMMKLHQNAELRHRKAGALGKVTPSTHGTVHEYIHPGA